MDLASGAWPALFHVTGGTGNRRYLVESSLNYGACQGRARVYMPLFIKYENKCVRVRAGC